MTKNEKAGPAAEYLRPVEAKRASEAIFAQIRDLIISGKLKPGERLPSERDMMYMLGRSRPPIREALRMLENAGFIKSIPGSGGAVVQTLSTSSVEEPLANMLALSHITKEELLEYRRLNDVTFAGWAAERRTDEDLEAINANIEKMSKVLDDPEEFILCDIEFHKLIADAGKNSFAKIVTAVISASVMSMLSTNFADVEEKQGNWQRENVLRVHRKIFEAIQKCDAEAARNATQEHMLGFETDFKHPF